MTTTTARLWLVNPFDPVPGATHSPPMRYQGFARALADGGWDVTWLTADFDHLTRRYRVPPDVDRVSVTPRLRVEYIHVPPYRATFGAARIRSHRSYTRGLRTRMRALGAERPTVILASLPLLASLRACLAYRRRAGCAVVTDIQDTWPEALTSLLPKPLRRGYRALRGALVRAEERQVRTCDGVIAVSETYLRERHAPDVPALCAYIGVDLEAFDAEMRTAGLDPAARPAPGPGPVTFLWTGTIRPAADLPTVIRAAALVRARGVLARFVIAGDGPRRPMLEALARTLDLGPETIVFRGAYPAAERARLVFESHVGLNAYVAEAANTTTNKLFDYQAASLAIVNSLPGEVGRLIADHGMGRSYLAGDAESLAAAIVALVREPARIAAMGRAARRFAEAHGSRAVISRRVVAFLEDVPPPRSNPGIMRYAHVKRGLDVVGALVVLSASLPLVLLAALAVRATMGAPILFRQRRTGLHGREFVLLKLRTMRAARVDTGAAGDGERLTALGRWLRAASIDELPQLWNVLRGDMSLVGPRPLLPAYLPRYSPTQARRHEVPPGITGLTQVSGRNALGWEEKFQLDVWYVDHRSLRLDLWILWRTVFVVLAPTGVRAIGHATMPEFLGSEASTR